MLLLTAAVADLALPAWAVGIIVSVFLSGVAVWVGVNRSIERLTVKLDGVAEKVKGLEAHATLVPLVAQRVEALAGNLSDHQGQDTERQRGAEGRLKELHERIEVIADRVHTTASKADGAEQLVRLLWEKTTVHLPPPPPEEVPR